MGLLKYFIGVACAFRFLGEGGISKAKLWSKIPEKMKIGGIFSDLLTHISLPKQWPPLILGVGGGGVGGGWSLALI
jgi:hypothetical protein